MLPTRLQQLVTEHLDGVVVLTHDSSVWHGKRKLGDYPLVYGIRAAKGLEFKPVIVLDFFAEIPREHQKSWRDLLLGREIHKAEIEGQLKLLYTALNRWIEQLFFAETSCWGRFCTVAHDNQLRAGCVGHLPTCGRRLFDGSYSR